MNRALVLLAALAFPTAALGAGTAYYKPQVAAAQSAEGKKNATDEKADLDAKKAQATKADEDAIAAEKVHAADAAAKRQHARELDEQLVQQYQQAQYAHAKHLSDRIERILPIVRKARHLDALIAVPQGSDIAPAIDLTGEIRRHLDAGEGRSDEDLAGELARAKARIAELEAAKQSAPEPSTIIDKAEAQARKGGSPPAAKK